MPILLSLTLLVIRFIKNDSLIFLDKYKILFAVVYVSFVFEFWLPSKSAIYTGDVFDVFCYGFGALIFYSIQHRWFPIIKQEQTSK